MHFLLLVTLQLNQSCLSWAFYLMISALQITAEAAANDAAIKTMICCGRAAEQFLGVLGNFLLLLILCWIYEYCVMTELHSL
jgi:hypothetical protein